MGDKTKVWDDATGRSKAITKPQAQTLLNVADGAGPNNLALTNNNAGAITQGQAVYVDGSNTVDLADGSSTSTEAKASVIGLVNEASISASASGKIAVIGPVTVPSGVQVGTWVAGDEVFLDEDTPGKLNNVAPGGLNEWWEVVGRCLDTPGGGDATVVLRIERPVQIEV